MNEFNKYMISFGFSIEDINKIENQYPLNELTPEKLFKNIKNINEFFIEFGYTKQDIILISTLFPNIYHTVLIS